MRLRAPIIKSAAVVARMVVVLAALVVALNIHPIHAHAILDAPGDNHLGDDCGSHSAGSGGAAHLPVTQEDCGNYFDPLFRMTSLSLFSFFKGAGPERDGDASPQIFHGFDPPPPRLPS